MTGVSMLGLSMADADKTYQELLWKVLQTGTSSADRTGTGTTRIFGHQMRFDLSDNKIPLLTIKKMWSRSIIHELIWFLTGDTNIKYLNDNNVSIWNAWADENGDLGPVYGHQWRNFDNKLDQIVQVIENIKSNPDSRRLIVSAWNPIDVPNMALPPCHMMFQFMADPISKTLACMLTQRSADVPIGLPFNIAQYSMLTHMIAQIVGYTASEFIWSGGDCHIYNNQESGVSEILGRDPEKYTSPTIALNKEIKNIDDFTFNDIKIEDYECDPFINIPVAV
jgi:thymidylate synthase